jgi:hypothetical protein
MAQDDNAATPVPRAPLTSTATGQSIYIGLWILGTLVAVAIMVGAFLLGQNLSAEDEESSLSATEEVPEVSFPILSGTPVEPGEWTWQELQGGECLSNFAGAFAESYTVVDCVTSHDAQLLSAFLLSSNPEEAYPGEDVVAGEAKDVCDVRDIVNYTLAEGYDDLVVDYSYPVSEEQWGEGQRGVYCFVLRSSGGTLSGDLLD